MSDPREGTVTKDLAESALKGAEAELAKAESAARVVADEIAKSRLAIQALLGRLYRISKEFPTWKTIKLGTRPNVAALKRAIIAQKNRISPWGNDILDRISVSPKETEIDLVRLTVAELGLPKGGIREQIYEKAKELGLYPCPAEVGPQIRLQYQDQPSGEWLLIGMEPITDSNGDPHVFYVGHVSVVRWLSARNGDAGHFWSPESRWVFVRRK